MRKCQLEEGAESEAERYSEDLNSHSARVTKSSGSIGFTADFLLPYSSLQGFRDAEGLHGKDENIHSTLWSGMVPTAPK